MKAPNWRRTHRKGKMVEQLTKQKSSRGMEKQARAMKKSLTFWYWWMLSTAQILEVSSHRHDDADADIGAPPHVYSGRRRRQIERYIWYGSVRLDASEIVGRRKSGLTSLDYYGLLSFDSYLPSIDQPRNRNLVARRDCSQSQSSSDPFRHAYLVFFSPSFLFLFMLFYLLLIQ